MSWPVIKFSEAISRSGLFSDGDWVESKDQDPEGDVRLIQLADIGVGEFIDKSNRFMTSKRADELRCSYLKAGDILVARMPDPIGRACIFPEDMGRCVTVVDICIVRPDSERIDNRWLMHLINSERFRNQIDRHVTGTTRQRISRGNLAGLEIPLPPLSEQKRIAAILDKADAIRRKRQQAIQLADDFLRAVFLDMFGDPVTNPKGWPVEHLKDITTKIGSGSTPRGGSEAYLDQGISLIRSLNIHDDDFRMKNLAFIDDEQAEKLSNVLVQNGDVLLNITGASVCRCAIVPAAVLPARVNQHVCIIRPSDAVNSSYLLHLLISEPYKQKLLKMSGAGATREALTKQQVEMLEVPIPPKDLQTKFEEIKDKVRSLSSASDSFKEESIFESLSDKAFSGLL